MARELVLGTTFHQAVEIARRIERVHSKSREVMTKDKRHRHSSSFRVSSYRAPSVQVPLVGIPILRGSFNLDSLIQPGISMSVESWEIVEEHKQHLRIALQILREKKPYAKFFKFDFWLD
nr:uncharacterized protein LOC104106567 [Nicotiana tomentosiformis]